MWHMWPNLVQSNRPYWSSTCCLHTTHEWNTYFPNDCIYQIHSDKSVSYLQRAAKRLNADNCSCTAICPSKVYPNILLEYPKRTNATIREGEKTLTVSANIHWYIDRLQLTYYMMCPSFSCSISLSLSISSINNFPPFSSLFPGCPGGSWVRPGWDPSPGVPTKKPGWTVDGWSQRNPAPVDGQHPMISPVF